MWKSSQKHQIFPNPHHHPHPHLQEYAFSFWARVWEFHSYDAATRGQLSSNSSSVRRHVRITSINTNNAIHSTPSSLFSPTLAQPHSIEETCAAIKYSSCIPNLAAITTPEPIEQAFSAFGDRISQRRAELSEMKRANQSHLTDEAKLRERNGNGIVASNPPKPAKPPDVERGKVKIMNRVEGVGSSVPSTPKSAPFQWPSVLDESTLQAPKVYKLLATVIGWWNVDNFDAKLFGDPALCALLLYKYSKQLDEFLHRESRARAHALQGVLAPFANRSAIDRMRMHLCGPKRAGNCDYPYNLECLLKWVCVQAKHH
jgi:hypothetical protein